MPFLWVKINPKKKNHGNMFENKKKLISDTTIGKPIKKSVNFHKINYEVDDEKTVFQAERLSLVDAFDHRRWIRSHVCHALTKHKSVWWCWLLNIKSLFFSFLLSSIFLQFVNCAPVSFRWWKIKMVFSSKNNCNVNRWNG